ncbi:anthranilate synthase component I [Paludibacterium purpuratum]|uniref:Anthranilate synthase n=1 Tax=Paludibacterium purpuratum TaxID=1144873 RepID=A0A4R7BBJ2_9NEIS|nr:anthranilate synthase component I [Paludibacterium purpuratum]TDR82023.1 anthranilate synthase component I [Paludibacterium purpuratum]
MQRDIYLTRGGIEIERETIECAYPQAGQTLIDSLNARRGVWFSSRFEFPGRYTRWDMGFVDPPLALTTRGRDFSLAALNGRGQALLPVLAARLAEADELVETSLNDTAFSGRIVERDADFSEEERSRQPSAFSLVRALSALFASDEDRDLGLYGAFGYDLVFQFEPMALRLERASDQRDLVLYLPDELLLVDHMQQRARRLRYDFRLDGAATHGLPRDGSPAPYRTELSQPPADCDHAPGEYVAQVERARQAFARGDLFEVVLGQLFAEPCADTPSDVFRRLQHSNPAPYGALINLGEGEFLVAASPEMFVRVEGRRIETCPISGTIARGGDALADARQILTLLNSAKDESELTMCTDVDRNDKSRVCEPGSVRVIGRRQIEMYSRLIHTVDHVEGVLRAEFDALDGFLSHAWAVTVTGAPKRSAISFIEQHEHSPRRWYGGAIGRLSFDGNMNTGLTLRTVRMKDGIAEVRAGATLLFDSDAASEDAECRLKASAQRAAISAQAPAAMAAGTALPARGRHVLLIDHEDSFVHTLAGYLRAEGAEVVTLRAELARERLAAGLRPDLALLSPGPGRPDDFSMRHSLEILIGLSIPTFGVCLGLQGMVEYFGGRLGQLPLPVHGKASMVRNLGGRLLADLPERFEVGRYHSLYAERATLPDCLRVCAETDDGIVMAIEHSTLPLAAVQFHPESIMTLGAGPALMAALLRNL